MHAISSYPGDRPTHKQTHRQDRLQYTAPQLTRSITKLRLLRALVWPVAETWTYRKVEWKRYVDGPLTRFSRSRHFWSWISQKRCVLGTKLLWNTNRKPYTIYRDDLDWPLNTSRRLSASAELLVCISLLGDPDILSVLVYLASVCIIIRILRPCFAVVRFYP